MSKQRNILVVDDERTIREVVRRYLELEGYLVTEAETGPQALSILQSQTPDLIVLDIMLPGVDGFSITRRLRHPSESNPLRIEGEIPIISADRAHKRSRSHRRAGTGSRRLCDQTLQPARAGGTGQDGVTA